MKLKTRRKIDGAILTGAFSFVTYGSINLIIDYSKLSSFSTGELACLVGIYSVTPCLALSAVEGVVDIIKGTRHYFLARLWQKLTKNQETKKRIEKSLENMLNKRERVI